MNHQPPVSYSTLILYSQKDEQYKHELHSQIRFFLGKGNVANFKYSSLEQSDPHTLQADRIINRHLALIYLVSYDLIKSDFAISSNFSKLVGAHKLRQIQIFPIILDECDFQITSLKDVSLLRSNKVPFSSLQKDRHMHIWRNIREELMDGILATMEYHRSIEDQWKQACKKNTPKSYLNFLQKYPYSKFSPQAKSIYERMREEELWKDAQLFKETYYYLQYIKSAPLGKYKSECIEKIIEIENNEEAARQDMYGNENLGIFLDYKYRFREKGDMATVEERIIQIMEKPVGQWICQEEEIETESHYLNYEIYKSCSESEVLTFELFEKLYGELGRGIEFLIHKSHKLIGTLRFYVFPLLPGLILVGILGELLLFEKNILFRLPRGWFPNLILWGLVLWMGYKVYRAFRAMRKDITAFEKKKDELQKNWMQLKIAFLTQDVKVRSSMIFYLYKTEDWLQKNNKKGLINYFFKSKKKEHPQQKRLSAIESRLRQINTACMSNP